MIVTAFVTGNDPAEHAAAERFEYAWQRAGQPGELVRLAAGAAAATPPLHSVARVEPVLSWTIHPYIDDSFFGYNLPAALLTWLLREPLDATVLLLDADCLLTAPIAQEVAPGEARAQEWPQFPRGEGPFALPTHYESLRAWCVNRELELPQVRLPLLMHSTDLKLLAARWLELIGLLRPTLCSAGETDADCVHVALAIAAAEYRRAPQPTDFSAMIARAGEEQYAAMCERFDSDRASGEHLRLLRPTRRPGVRQGRVLDQWYLELGSPPGMVNLNVSAGEIWSLCNGERNLFDITQTLHEKYGLPIAKMAGDVAQAATALRAKGAIDLETASP